MSIIDASKLPGINSNLFTHLFRKIQHEEGELLDDYIN